MGGAEEPVAVYPARVVEPFAVIAKRQPVHLLWAMEPAPNDEAKARRAVRILYFCMAVGITLPFVLLWLLR